MSEALETIDLFRYAFAGGLLIAVACGLLGIHVVARRLTLLGLTLPQAAALGIAASLALAGTHGHGLGHGLGHDAGGFSGQHQTFALVAELLVVGLVAWPAANRALGRDTLAGALFAICAAGSILVVAHSAAGREEVHHLVEGNLLEIGGDEFRALLLALVPVVLLCVLGSRRLFFATVDRDAAASAGVRVWLWDALFYAALTVTIAVSVHAAGTLFVFACLVLPAAAGIVAGRGPVGVALGAAAVAALAAAGGFLASASEWDTPTGPTCAVALGALVVVALIVSAVRDRLGARPAAPEHPVPPDRHAQPHRAHASDQTP